MRKKPIILLVGPSGSGKSTISRELHEKYGLKELQSYTTRKPRFPHEPGHTFVTDEEFDTLKDQVAFTDFNGHRYCATAQQVDENDIYVIDLEGCRTFRQTYHGDKVPMAFWIECDPAVIRQRMFLRDGSLEAASRMAHDVQAFDGGREELGELFEYTFVIENTDVEKAADEIMCCVDIYCGEGAE